MNPAYYIGIMSGTSLDGVDAILADFSGSAPILHQTYFLPYPKPLQSQLLSLHQPGDDELNRAALVSNQLSQLYAKAVIKLLAQSAISSQQVIAIGCHGQTVRHCPETEKRYTIQLVNAALLAELTGIAVVTDFRNRDIAAGGQGAPLVPAFHQAIFQHTHITRAIVNIGGIANITSLPVDQMVTGFDCGPGNMLMDAWCLRHTRQTYDKNGDWAAQGRLIPHLLNKLLSEPFFSLEPPKSTGRDLFNIQWLDQFLIGNETGEDAKDVQATLLQLTAITIANSIERDCAAAKEIFVCGGGAHNAVLMARLKELLAGRKVLLTDDLGVAADWVEAYAFAWLAQQTMLKIPANLPAVTGAKGARVLGAIYPA